MHGPEGRHSTQCSLPPSTQWYGSSLPSTSHLVSASLLPAPWQSNAKTPLREHRTFCMPIAHPPCNETPPAPHRAKVESHTLNPGAAPLLCGPVHALANTFIPPSAHCRATQCFKQPLVSLANAKPIEVLLRATTRDGATRAVPCTCLLYTSPSPRD